MYTEHTNVCFNIPCKPDCHTRSNIRDTHHIEIALTLKMRCSLAWFKACWPLKSSTTCVTKLCVQNHIDLQGCILGGGGRGALCQLILHRSLRTVGFQARPPLISWTLSFASSPPPPFETFSKYIYITVISEHPYGLEVKQQTTTWSTHSMATTE